MEKFIPLKKDLITRDNFQKNINYENKNRF